MKFKKLTIAAVAALAVAATASLANAAEPVDPADVKVGIIYIGDENEGYTAAHMAGIDAMQ